MISIGCDPGKNGAIAWIDGRGNACVEKMPDNLQDLWGIFQDLAPIPFTGEPVRAYLEQVNAGVFAAPDKDEKKRRMGVTSAFTFGNGFGHLEMALTAAKIPFVRVRPKEWQEALGCMTKGNKNITKQKASELFPHIKCTHAVSDALLLAYYGSLQK